MTYCFFSPHNTKKYELKSVLVAFFFFTTIQVAAAQTVGVKYHYSIDLNQVIDDKLKVTLVVPDFHRDDLVFHFPKIVPGTYAIYDFGRYISNLKAFGFNGKPVKVTRLDLNSWKISGAKKLKKITYLVDDTWDSPEITGAEVFQPAGTDIDKDKVFVINNFGFFGYFGGKGSVPFEITVTKPAGFYGSTALTAHHKNATTDVYNVADFYSLADAPMMYNRPDTTFLHIGGADVLVSLYSPNHKAVSTDVATQLKATLEAQKAYLGGRLPVNKYAFIIVLTDQKDIKSFGALEHSYSSFYFLPESFAGPQLAQTIVDAGSHEFFHIVTPLSIHSEEIGHFDYDHPKMSAHLWMYEGLTEYAAHHMQLKYGLVSFPDYLEVQTQKMNDAMMYNDTLPFTVMSKGVLDTFASQFLNVYAKGAMIVLCLDIRLRQLSKGLYGTQNLMRDLSKRYGRSKSFKDDELFKTITALTYPEIGVFLNSYVGGNQKLPYKMIFDAIGVDYQPVVVLQKANFGKPGVGYNPETRNLFIRDTSQIDNYGKRLGYQLGDEIISVNGQKPHDIAQVQTFLDSLRESLKTNDTLAIVVLRKDGTGQPVEIKLSQPVEMMESKKYNLLKEYDILTDAQKALRKAWLNTEN